MGTRILATPHRQSLSDFRMKNLTATVCLTIGVLIGSVRMC
jgi:hypothetical protein